MPLKDCRPVSHVYFNRWTSTIALQFPDGKSGYGLVISFPICSTWPPPDSNE